MLTNPFMIKIIFVEQTAKFWDGTNSSSSEQAKQCSENSWQKLIQLQIIQKAQKAVRWRVTRVIFPSLPMSVDCWIFWQSASILVTSETVAMVTTDMTAIAMVAGNNGCFLWQQGDGSDCSNSGDSSDSSNGGKTGAKAGTAGTVVQVATAMMTATTETVSEVGRVKTAATAAILGRDGSE